MRQAVPEHGNKGFFFDAFKTRLSTPHLVRWEENGIVEISGLPEATCSLIGY